MTQINQLQREQRELKQELHSLREELRPLWFSTLYRVPIWGARLWYPQRKELLPGAVVVENSS
jgi:hypothetical protein